MTEYGRRSFRGQPLSWSLGRAPRRLLPALAALAIIAFSLWSLPGALRAADLRTLTDAILDGQSFSDQFVRRLERAVRDTQSLGTCEAAADDIAVVRLFLAGIAGSSAQKLESRTHVAEARASLREALACSPYKPFLWFLLFWLESRENLEAALPYLRLSYGFGRYEGWIAGARSRATLSILDRLPNDLQRESRAEYGRLLQTNFEAAFGLFLESDPATRNRILVELSESSIEIRTSFARRLEAANIEATVPGIEPRAR